MNTTTKEFDTCYDAVKELDCPCMRKSCKHWVSYENGKNCMLITTQSGPLTLNEVGKIYGLTRMRICQIEKNIYAKIRDYVIQ